jgi:hypothetical protein
MADLASEGPGASELPESVDTLFVTRRKRSEAGARAASARDNNSASEPRSPKEPKPVAPKRQLLSIDGLCRCSGKLFAFVHYEDTPEAQVVSIKHLHRSYWKELIAFYESHVSLPERMINSDLDHG